MNTDIKAFNVYAYGDTYEIGTLMHEQEVYAYGNIFEIVI